MSHTAAHEETLWGQPKGLYILFFTEMWERFSYYGMRALLTLYLISKVGEGGFGWSEGEALALYGWYTMFVYVACVPGGIIADRLLGQKKCVMLGGLFLCVGHAVMAVPGITPFYVALALIITGVGLLKPNISTMVGGLYPAGDSRRDMGFSIFYMGINVGAFGSALIVGTVGERYGWHYGFGLAGIGMAFGQLVFMYGQKYLTHVGNRTSNAAKTAQASQSVPLTKVERSRIFVALVSFMIVVVFWCAFEQAGGLMSIYTKQKVDRHFAGIQFPASTFQSLNPLFIILFATVVAGYWHRRLIKGKQASALFTMAIGTMIMGLGFVFMVFSAQEAAPQEAIGKRAEAAVIAAGEPSETSAIWELIETGSDADNLDLHVNTEANRILAGVEDAESLRPSIEGALQATAERAIATRVQAELAAAELAATNPSPAELVAAQLAAADLAAKISVTRDGAVTAIAEASYASAVHASTAMFWLILAYLFHTIGELCLSPVALSFVTKLSPARYASLMMGLYFAVTGIGNKLAGVVGEQIENYEASAIFAGIAVFTVLSSALLLAFLRPLNRMTHGAEDISDVVDEG